MVVGAPNIQDFSPSSNAILHIKELKDIPSVSKSMKYLADHPEAYNQSLRLVQHLSTLYWSLHAVVSA